MIQGMLKKELVKISSDTGEILHGIKKKKMDLMVLVRFTFHLLIIMLSGMENA